MSTTTMIRTFLRRLGAVLALLPALAAQAGTVTYFHNDPAGSPVAATNEQKQVVWRESYRPYGERLTNSPAASGNDIWFTSRRQDAETGLVYMGARYYDPVAGRFVSTDPAGFDEGNVHSFNRYAYANNNPYRYVDPDGQAAEDLFPTGAPIVAFGKFLGGAAAYAQGAATGNEALRAAGSSGMAENRLGMIEAAIAIASVGRSTASSTRSSMSIEQEASLVRFEKKLPANSSDVRVYDLPGGGKAFQADSASRNVPGSYAQYEKQISAAGEATQVTKTTFGPKGEIVHVKDKLTGQTIRPE